MNVIQTIKDHRCVRDFLDKEISNEHLHEILESAHLMPTSYNSQQVSVVVVKDTATKEKIAELSGNLPYIKKAPIFLVFVTDLYKTHLACEKNNTDQIDDNNLDIIVSATFDAGLSMAGAILAAESLGLGVVPVGAIRTNLEELKNILELPKHVIPLVGLSIGYSASATIKKPRLDIESFAHFDNYKKDNLMGYINKYDELMETYLAKINRKQEKNWSTSISMVYSNTMYFEQITNFINKV